MSTRQQRRYEERMGAGMRGAIEREQAAARAAYEEVEVKQPEPRANRKMKRLGASQRYRRTHLNRTDAEGDNLDNEPIYREVRQLSIVNGLKRKRRDSRIRNGAREARGGPDPMYDEKKDMLVLTHPTKGRRPFSRRRLELQAKMQRLLNPKLFRQPAL